MSEYASPRNTRGPKRKFDHDEARRRRASGESVTSIARSYGVRARDREYRRRKRQQAMPSDPPITLP